MTTGGVVEAVEVVVSGVVVPPLAVGAPEPDGVGATMVVLVTLVVATSVSVAVAVSVATSISVLVGVEVVDVALTTTLA